MFFSRWKNLNIPSQECQKIFKAAGGMENNDAVKTKLLGYGFQVRTFISVVVHHGSVNLFYSQLLENIDPNPDNFVSAGIIHTRSAQIGCLLRLEPNKQAQVRLTELPNQK